MYNKFTLSFPLPPSLPLTLLDIKMSKEIDQESEVELEPPTPKKCCTCSFDDPGFFVLFVPPAEVHRLLGLPARNHPTNARAPVIPAQAATHAQSFIAFSHFLDEVALFVGMTRQNMTFDTENQREPGLFDGVQQHHADCFEQTLNSYNWQFAAGDTLGKFYRVSPSGPGRTTFTHKTVGPFQ